MVEQSEPGLHATADATRGLHDDAKHTSGSQGSTRVRGFADVLAEMTDWPVLAGADAATVFGNRRRMPLPDGPVTIDSVDLAAGSAGEVRLDGDEFVQLLDGELTIRQSGAEMHLEKGESVVLLRKQPLDWSSVGGAKLIAMGCSAGGGAGSPAPVKIDLDATLEPSAPPLAQYLLTPSPQCRVHRDYVSANGEFGCGVWDSTPYHRSAFTYAHYELMSLLEGAVTFVDPAGREGHFGVGALILLEQGGASSWENREHVRKVYASYRPTV
jgi:uncharacterized cupin superfamily protein